MKTNYLFPHRLRVISGLLFISSFLLYVGYYVFDSYIAFDAKAKVFALIGDTGIMTPTIYIGLIDNYIIDEILMLVIIPAGIVYAFTKEKHEDELVAAIRLHSLAWATIANYGIILFLYLFVYGFPFLNVIMGAMFSQLLIFIVVFRYKIYRFQKSAGYEE